MNFFICLFLYLIVVDLSYAIAKNVSSPFGTIAFSSVGTCRFGFDIYQTEVQLEVNKPFPYFKNIENFLRKKEVRLTDGVSRNYNAAFSSNGQKMIFVSERDGNMELYLKDAAIFSRNKFKRLTHGIHLDDHASFSPDGDTIAFVSTRQPSMRALLSWSSIYTMNIRVGELSLQRLTPHGVSDFSPSWSPNGEYIAFAKYHDKMCKDFEIGMMKRDGSGRRILVNNGGWPTWRHDSEALFFHSFRGGEWGIYEVVLNSKTIRRVSPKGINVMTPSGGISEKWIVVATRHQGSIYRQIELLNLNSGQLHPITSDDSHHYNPVQIQISSRAFLISYHKCRGTSDRNLLIPNAEPLSVPRNMKDLSLIRVEGEYPAFSPNGWQIATTSDFTGVDILDINSSTSKRILNIPSFYVSWSKENILAASNGHVFQPPNASVNIVTINEDGTNFKTLSEGIGGNNAFPSFSPNGDKVVFRSGNDGNKNLYILNVNGGGRLVRLTNGNWTDTMPNWSPDGKWITFSRSLNGSFSLWVIQPNGANLRKIFDSSGRTNHPWFSPDMKNVVFTSDFAGCSVEAISMPFQYQPYGEIFVKSLEDSLDTGGLHNAVRLTHNGYEDGTPSWGKVKLDSSFFKKIHADECRFFDMNIDLQGKPLKVPKCKYGAVIYAKILETKSNGSNYQLLSFGFLFFAVLATIAMKKIQTVMRRNSYDVI